MLLQLIWKEKKLDTANKRSSQKIKEYIVSFTFKFLQNTDDCICLLQTFAGSYLYAWLLAFFNCIYESDHQRQNQNKNAGAGF